MKLLAFVGSGKRVLDVGCSSGYLARPLVERGCTVVGIELDEKAAEAAGEVCAEVLVGDVETMEFPFPEGSFDVVLCGDLIEHLRAPERFLARVRPLLRDDGRLVLTTPNVANWTMRLGLLAGRWRYTERGILDRTHLHLFTRGTLARDTRECGVPDPRARPHRPGTRCRSTVRGTGRPYTRAPATFALRLSVRGRRSPRPMISVVIPVKDGGLDLVRCLEAIARQQVDDQVEIVVIDSGSSDGSVERARRLGARVHEIRPEEFSHGGARNLGAELARGDILVFTSQDAYATDEVWLASLVAPLRDRNEVAGVYGRQLPHDEAIPSERYFLDFLYGPELAHAASRRSRTPQLSRDAVLQRQLRSAARPCSSATRWPPT